MLYYIVPYIILIISSLLSIKVRGSGFKLLFFVGLIPAIFICSFRGLVGQDTGLYLYWISLPSDESSLEIGFKIYAYIVQLFEINYQYAINFIGFTISIILFFFLSKSKHHFLIFVFLIFPIFYYDMTMNGIRYGLAFSLSIPFILESQSNFLKITTSKFFYFLALLNHNSSSLFLTLKLSLNLKFKYFVFLLISSAAIFYFLYEYILKKFNDYSNEALPGAFSGIQPLVLSILVVLINNYFFTKNITRNLYILSIQLLCFLITQFSWAGIRFQFLVLFFLLILIINDKYCKNYSTYMLLLFFVGLIGFLFKIRNMLNYYGEPPTPFLPYLFIWN